MTFRIGLIFSILLFSLSAIGAKLKIVATIPEVAWLVKEIGGAQVEVTELSRGDVDLHFLEARVDYIIKLRDADALCYGGLGLEIGWLPKVVQRSGNLKLRPNQIGDCNLGASIEVLNKPQGIIDRSMGDVHAQGNPHYTSDPLMMVKAAEVVTNTLVKLSPKNKKTFEESSHKLRDYLIKLHREISEMLSTIKNRKALSYHSEFNYWLNTYGFQNMGMLEDKPGMPPSAGRIAKMAANVKKESVSVLLYTDFNSHSIVEKFRTLSKVKAIKFDAHANSSGRNSYKDWQIGMAQRLLNEFNLKF